VATLPDLEILEWAGSNDGSPSFSSVRSAMLYSVGKKIIPQRRKTPRQDDNKK